MKYPDDYINKVICGDCLTIMRDIPDKSIDMVLTSPPYDNLRDYKGYTFNFEGTAKELFRIIKDGGVCVWVVGDRMEQESETGLSFKQALYFKDIGFKLHDTMIYAKNGIAFPCPTRYHQCFEYMFILVKGKIKTVNLIKDKDNSQKNKIHKNRWERQKNGNIRFRNKEQYTILKTGARWNIWQYEIGWMKTTTEKKAFEHPAMFPEALASDHIQSWSNENDIVLDCFNGSGTTTKMVKQLGRRFIGIEISPEYCKIAEDRLRQEVLFKGGKNE